jgi:vacuolar protein sorting-associated protein 13D
MYQHVSLKHQFVLSPVIARAYIKRNRSEQPLRSRTQPRIVCDLHLEEVPLSLTDVSSSVFSVLIELSLVPFLTFV